MTSGFLEQVLSRTSGSPTCLCLQVQLRGQSLLQQSASEGWMSILRLEFRRCFRQAGLARGRTSGSSFSNSRGSLNRGSFCVGYDSGMETPCGGRVRMGATSHALSEASGMPRLCMNAWGERSFEVCSEVHRAVQLGGSALMSQGVW